MIKGVISTLLIGASLSAPIMAAQDDFVTGMEGQTDPQAYQNSYPQSGAQAAQWGTSNGGSGIDGTSYLSFNRNPRMAVGDGVSFDSNLGRLSLSNDVAVSGFTRVNDTEQHYGIGLNLFNSQVTMIQGKGRGFSRLANTFTDLDPYYLHGGTSADYEFSTVELGHQLTPGFSLQAGRAEIRSQNSERRYTYFAGASAGEINAAYMRVNRGEEKVGDTYSLAYASAIGTLNLSSVRNIQGGQINAVSYTYRALNASQYALTFSNQSNPLIADEGSYRVMVSFGRPLGKVSRMGAADTQGTQQTMSKGNIALLGGVALAAGLVLSSGSSSQDNAVRLDDQHAAAREVLNEINPVSTAQNREYGGWVYATLDGRYTSTTPVSGSIDSVDLPFSLIPKGGRPLASYHTHGDDDPRYVNEAFSATDIAADDAVGLDGYLGTPAGQFLWHDVSSSNVQSLGSIAN